MPTPKLTDEQIQEAVAALAEHGSQRAAALAMGLARSSFQNRIERAAERGLMGTKPVLPGFRLTKTTAVTNADGDVVREFIQQRPEAGAEFELMSGHTIKGVSALVDPAGRVMQQWIKTREQPSATDIAATLKDAFKDWVPAAPAIVKEVTTKGELLSLVPCNDWHVGMFAWHRETDQNWDLRKAEQAIGDGIEDAIERSPASGTAIVLGGGDLTHADNNDNRTAKSGNVLDVDGRHQKVVGTAGRLMVRTVDAALRRNDTVIVRNLKGNHDEETAPSIAWFLAAWYRNEPRVRVDLDQSLFFYHQHSLVMLSAVHGHAAKLKDMPQIMAHRQPVMWGATRYRYAHGFHVHHQSKYASEGGGVIMESHQAPIPQDAWHFGSGFLSGRSLQTISYHREAGEVGRVRVAMIDAANDNEPGRMAA